MKSYSKRIFFFGIAISILFNALSQETEQYRLSLEQAVEMGLQNHQQLKISSAQVKASEEEVKVSKLQQLPSITLTANAFYLGDAVIMDQDLAKVQTVDMPHFGNTFGIEAAQLLYKGGVVKKSIEMAELKQQLAELDFAGNEQEIKFLIVSNYLDIYKLINQIQVLEQNKVHAEQLLANVTKLYKEDMVTRNEVIRSELLIKNLEQSILTVKNNHAILSNQMSYALGLPNNIIIIPTEKIEDIVMIESQSYYTDLARQHPHLQSAEKNVEIAEKNVSIKKTNWVPSISAFGGYTMQRPITTSTPALDLYSNSWQVGLNLSFNLDNLFRTKRQVNLSKSQARITRESLTYTRQAIAIEINAAYVKYQEAKQQIALTDKSRALANENYDIVKNKYLHQLAITAEMTDASNAKLNAELEYANAVVKALFQYYNLLKATGTL